MSDDKPINGLPYDVGVDAGPTIKEERVRLPIFEIVIPSTLAVGMPLHHFKIWGDGKIEGFENLGNRKAIVTNRFPMMLDEIMQPVRDWVQDVNDAIDVLATPPAEGSDG